jgi:DNA primase
MGIVEDDIERIRSTVSIVDVIQQHLTLKRVGRNWTGICPFHAEKSPSFNVSEERGRYKCFGCSKGGDVFTFVQEIEHVDFAAAVEKLAARAGIQLTYTTGGEGKDRQRRKRLIDAMKDAVEWYHERLLKAPDAREARDYLRSRGLAGDPARQFKIGWAPDDWDQLSQALGQPADVLRDTGLAFTNRRNRNQDAFRGRVMFPIFSAEGDPIAFGGRVLPGSSDPAKYKNSPETPIYAKSKVFYGLNWAKGDIVASDQVIVCEGYTDVIGFHRAGISRAVATCGTALTEEHVRTLKRYTSKVVLAFDADAAGQGAAQRFYEWEQKYQVEVKVARFPAGRDPGDLASSDPDMLRDAPKTAPTFLEFRLDRVLNSRRGQTAPEQRVRLAEEAMAVVNEHPSRDVRKLYAGQVATATGLPVVDLMASAERGGNRMPSFAVPTQRRAMSENAEFAALTLLMNPDSWDIIAPWLSEALFVDDVHLRAFRAIAEAGGDVNAALELADPEARDVLERAAVTDLDVDPDAEARNLVGAAVRRMLARRTRIIDPDQIREDREARQWLEQLDIPHPDPAVADALLQWLVRRTEE